MGTMATYAEWLKQRSQQGMRDKTSSMMGQYENDPQSGFSIAGTNEQQMETAANLSQVGAMTGQNLYKTGHQSQDYINSIQNRRSGGGAVAAQMKNQRNNSMAQMSRQMAGRKVAGGVAGAGMASAANSADASIATQQQNFGRQNDQDLLNWIKRQQKIEGEALANGADKGLAAEISTDSGQGLTVICGELHRQGLLDDATYSKDAHFGRYLMEYDPYVLIGYTVWAVYAVELMRKHKLFTKFFGFFAIRWAKHISGEDNLVGKTLLTLGMPICRLIGKAYVKLSNMGFQYV